MRYASVCDGIGAVHVAWQPLGWHCEWTAEIDAFPAAVVEQRWGFPNRGDMTRFKEWDDAPIELLVGGTPCQSFSVAGLRKGLHDPRGGLMLTFLEIAQRYRPRWVVWENVPGVLSSNGGRDFGAFLGALGELGYGWAYRVLDAQWFGVAQRRRRVFVVGCLGDERRAAQVLFESESVRRDNPPSRKAGQGAAAAASSDTGSGGVVNAVCSKWSKGTGGPAGDECQNLVAFHHNAQADQLPSQSRDTSITDSLTTSQRAAVAFTKAKRAQSTTDDESRVPGEVAPTFNCFDQGDTRATTVVAHDVHGTLAKKGASETDVHTALRSRSPGQSEASTTTVVAFTQNSRDEVRQINGDGQLAGALSAEGGIAQNQLGEVRTNSEVMGTVNTNQNASGRNTPMVMQAQGFTHSGYSNKPAWITGDRTDCLPSSGHGDTSHQGIGVMTPMAVRRLTPMECERLQGFPDHYTAITYRNKPAADGPRYKALGNSMAVPVMRWIGERIAKCAIH